MTHATGLKMSAEIAMNQGTDCATFDQGQGRPLVFVHGNVSTHAVWKDVVAPLSDAFRCISYDLRGHGATPLPDERFELDDLVADLERLRNRLGLERLDLVAHSLGGIIVTAYARHYPARVRSLSLLATPAFRTEQAMEGAAALVEKVRRNGLASTLGGMASTWYREEFSLKHPDAHVRRLDEIMMLDEQTVIKSMELTAASEIGPWLESLDLPVLILTGEFAVGCDAGTARLMHERVAGSKLVVLEGLKNGILTEIPHVVAEKLREFLSGT